MRISEGYGSARFSHILIDEFQDVNPVQYEVLKLLAAPPFSIMAVGDDDSLFMVSGGRSRSV